jgi:hypothetical protein
MRRVTLSPEGGSAMMSRRKFASAVAAGATVVLLPDVVRSEPRPLAQNIDRAEPFNLKASFPRLPASARRCT